MQPLKMQGVVDIKDNSVIVRFKFMARPKNPSLVQRMAIRRMYESFPRSASSSPRRIIRLPWRPRRCTVAGRGTRRALPPPAKAAE